MKMHRWFTQRGPRFILRRAGALLERYGVRSERAEARIEAIMAVCERHHCAPTFPTPGRVVQAHTRFIRHLQDEGAEIAVHSYDHVDLKGYAPEEARDQLLKGLRTFDRYGIEYRGFRCPYLSCTPELIAALPSGLFGYSSNDAVSWDLGAQKGGQNGQGGRGALPARDGRKGDPIWKTINKFYDPRPAATDVAVPRMRHGLVEIPVCVPDDLQLHDGLGLGPEGLQAAWMELLDRTYQRGEIFTLIFHPELAERCVKPFDALLSDAEQRRPGVWLARLRDVRDWWCEKQGFGVNVSETATGWRMTFICTDRAAILVRDGRGADAGTVAAGTPWYGSYRRLEGKALDSAGERLPFLGVGAGVPSRVVEFLGEQGYILQAGDLAGRCAIYLDATVLAAHNTEVALLDYIESHPGPLVRFWRWPNGARSALAITGDLDALTLGDYATRLWVR